MTQIGDQTGDQIGERQLARAEHRAVLAAPADLLYQLVADATAAPLVFPTTVHVEQVQRGAGAERIRIWAAYGDDLRSWTSHRLLRPDLRRVSFQQDVPEPPVAFMRGEWRLEPLGADRTEVVLRHAYRAVDDDPAGLAWIGELADRISTGQLAALGAAAARAGTTGEPRLTVEDSAELSCPARVAYGFVQDLTGWVGPVPGVERVTVRRADGDLQVVDLVGVSPDGTRRESRLARVGIPPLRIAFKDLRPAPGLVAAHAGRWRFEPVTGGCRVTVRHDLAIDYAAVPATLGAAATPADARAHVRQTVRAASAAVLDHLATLR